MNTICLFVRIEGLEVNRKIDFFDSEIEMC